MDMFRRRHRCCLCVAGFIVTAIVGSFVLSHKDITETRRLSSLLITEKGDQRRCVENFLTRYDQNCRQTIRPNPNNAISTIAVWTSWLTGDKLLCPCIPGGLAGFVDDDFSLDNEHNVTSSNVDASSEDSGISMPGGRWLPDWCMARQRIAIVVPYRNREQHLKLFIRHIRKVMQRQLSDFTIFIVDQQKPALFNRGSLLNVGFVEASKRANFDCYILHDVDILPQDDRNFYTCLTLPRHIGVYLKNRGYRLRYDCLFGGIQAFTADQFSTINGYSNTFYGWGGEDDDLLRRVWFKNITVNERYPLCVSRFGTIAHKRDRGNSHGKNQHLGVRWRPDLYAIDGLNSLRYDVMSHEENQLYTRLKVRLLPPETTSNVATQFSRISSNSPTQDYRKCRLNQRFVNWKQSVV